MLIWIGVIIGVIILWLIFTYNGLIQLKVKIQASIQEIGNQLKRQASLIPNLIAATKGYMEHENEVYDKLTAARNLTTKAVDTNDLAKMMQASNKMSEAFKPMFALWESNPQFKSNETVAQLMTELRDTADKMMYARRVLIDLAADYNTKIQTIPTVFVAGLLGFKKVAGLQTPESGPHLEVSLEETKTPQVKL